MAIPFVCGRPMWIGLMKETVQPVVGVVISSEVLPLRS